MTSEKFKRYIRELEDCCKKSSDDSVLYSKRKISARTASLIASDIRTQIDSNGLDFEDAICVSRYSSDRKDKLHRELVRRCGELLNTLAVVYARFPNHFNDFNLQYAITELKNQLELEKNDNAC